MVYVIFLLVFPACVWCCDASTFTEHENHKTPNLNIKYSGEYNYMLSLTPIKLTYVLLMIPSYLCCHKRKIWCEPQSPQQALLVSMYCIVIL